MQWQQRVQRFVPPRTFIPRSQSVLGRQLSFSARIWRINENQVRANSQRCPKRSSNEKDHNG
jgi:hypothetical protein